MSNKQFTFLSVLFLLNASAIAQEGSSKAIISIEPLALADVFDGASLRLGTEFRISNQFSLAFAGGFYLNYLSATKIHPKGYLIKPALKYYLAKDRGLSRRFMGLEFEFKNQDYDFRDTMEFDDLRYERQYSMNRKVTCLTFKYGKVRKLGERFLIEYYGGLGIRYIRSVSDLPQFERDAILEGEEGECPIQEDFIRKTGDLIYPNLLVGIKIGYAFSN